MRQTAIILATGLAVLAACSKNEPAPTLKVSPEKKIVMDPNGVDKSVVSVTTNQSEFNFSCDKEWLTVAKGEKTLELSASKNKEGTERTAILTVTAGKAAPVSLQVKQGAKLEIGDYFAGGIIFWLNPDENGTPRGKVVAMREVSLKEQQDALAVLGKFALDVYDRRFLFMYKKQNAGEISMKDYNMAKDPVFKAWEGNTLDDGKANTAKLLSLIDKASEKFADMWSYEAAPFMARNGCEVAWFRKHIIEEKYMGYDDWYIPARDEMAELIKPVEGGSFLYEKINESIRKNSGIEINAFWSKEEKLTQEGKYYKVYYATSSEVNATENPDEKSPEKRIYIARFEKDQPWLETQPRVAILTCEKDGSAILRPIRQF